MESRWFELKEEAVALRKNGASIKTVEKQLGIPRSTLSGWFKTIKLSSQQQIALAKSSEEGLKKARLKANQWHRDQKALRLSQAKEEAEETIRAIDPADHAVLDLAFAMLYLGEGAKGAVTSIANSDPKILRFVLAVLRHNYDIRPSQVKCDLHLRADQDPEELKAYWSSELGIPLENFRGCYIDQRSAGKATYDHYKGVCLLYCGSIAIQRKLIYMYNLFCEKVAKLNEGD